MNSQDSHSGRQVRSGNRKIVVVANVAIEGNALREAIGLDVGDESCAEIRVTAPALISRLRYWLSDDAAARRNAALRLATGLESLSAAGIEADGQVGDSDPLLAIADALFYFDAEEIVIATQPQGRLNWLTRDLVARAQRRFAQRIVHVVIEPSEEATTSSTRSRTTRRIGSLHRARIQANG
jgi:hypothetical protein